MNRVHFWSQWLFYTSLLFALAGISYAFTGKSLLFDFYHAALAKIFWNQTTFPHDAEHFRSFVAGPVGGTVACTYLLLAYIARNPFRKKERWARNAIAVAFLTWFVVDTSVCIATGVYFQAFYINTASLFVKILPLLFTIKEFKNKSSLQ